MSISKISCYKEESLELLSRKAAASASLCDINLSQIHSKNALGSQIDTIPEWISQHALNTYRLNKAYLELIERGLGSEIPKKTAVILQDSQEKMKQISQILQPFLYLNLIYPPEMNTYLDSSRLLCLSQQRPIEDSTFEWHLNLGIMTNLIKRTKDEKLIELLKFLSLNYLAKVAPVAIKDINLREMTSDILDSRFQQGLLPPEISYNRESPVFDSLLHEEISKAMVPASGNLWKLTDTDLFSTLLPITFNVLENNPTNLINSWEENIFLALEHHFSAFPETFFHHFLPQPLLIDCTEFLQNSIYNSQQKDSNQMCQEKIKLLEDDIYKAISRGIIRFIEKHSDKIKTEEETRALKIFVYTNLLCIYRAKVKQVGVLKILPIFYEEKHFEYPGNVALFGEKKLTPQKFSKTLVDIKIQFACAKIEEFLNQSGIRLGSVNGRWALLDFLGLEKLIAITPQRQLTDYAISGYDSNGFDFPFLILNTALIQRLKKRFSQPCSSDEEKGFYILGNATLHLLEGLLTEIPEEFWVEINKNIIIKQLIQTCFYRILDHLANADLQRYNFAKSAQFIELAHAEFFNLLIVLHPFQEHDFAEIYKHSLTCIPDTLKNCLFPGLAKGSMNILAGFFSVLKSKCPDFQTAYHKGSHFESESLVGKERSLDEVLKKEDSSHIDFYLAEFNPNVNLSLDHIHYLSGNPIKEIDLLLNCKQPSRYFTLMVDATIDYKNSKKLHDLLEHLSPLIQKGTIQVIVYYSGQKFSMLGMDNYYGAPFCSIHNDDPKWEEFFSLWTSEAHRTDFYSLQWFCLSNKYASKEIDEYRKAIFENTRTILNRIPFKLLPGKNPTIKICTSSEDVDSCFIDIKISGENYFVMLSQLKERLFQIFAEENGKIHMRGGYGFYHPNVTFFVNQQEHGCTMRINPGLDTKETNLILRFLQETAESL